MNQTPPKKSARIREIRSFSHSPLRVLRANLSPSDRPTARPSDRAAFTLFELLVVITIIVFISIVTLINIFGATRAASYGAAKNDVYDALMLARQRACMDGSPAYFMLVDSTNYTVTRVVGSVSQIEIPVAGQLSFYDRYADLQSYATASTGTIYNMTRDNSWAFLLTNSPVSLTIHQDPQLGVATYDVPAYCLTVVPSGVPWQTNDIYGIELHTHQTLPKGFYFSLATSGANPPELPSSQNVIFKPDGTAEGLPKFAVIEKIRTANPVVFNIALNGHISSEQGGSL